MIIDLTGLVLAIMTFMVSIFTVRIWPWVKSKMTEQQMTTLGIVVDTLVYSAEQIFGAGKGVDKLNYVCEKLLAKGYKVDLDVIEAAVKRMNDMNDENTYVVVDDDPNDDPYM